MRPFVVFCIQIDRIQIIIQCIRRHIGIRCKGNGYRLPFHEDLFNRIGCALVIPDIRRVAHIQIRLIHDVTVRRVNRRRRKDIGIDQLIQLQEFIIIRNRPVIVLAVIDIVQKTFCLALLASVGNGLLVHHTDSAGKDRRSREHHAARIQEISVNILNQMDALSVLRRAVIHVAACKIRQMVLGKVKPGFLIRCAKAGQDARLCCRNCSKAPAGSPGILKLHRSHDSLISQIKFFRKRLPGSCLFDLTFRILLVVQKIVRRLYPICTALCAGNDRIQCRHTGQRPRQQHSYYFLSHKRPFSAIPAVCTNDYIFSADRHTINFFFSASLFHDLFLLSIAVKPLQ